METLYKLGDQKEHTLSALTTSSKSKQPFLHIDDILVLVVDPGGKVLRFNDNLRIYFPLKKGQTIPCDILSSLFPSLEGKKLEVSAMLQTIVARDKHPCLEEACSYTSPKGEKVHIIWSVRLIKDSKGISNEIIFYGHPTSHLHYLQQQLIDSEKRFSTIADFSCDWEEWLLPDGSLEYVSPSCFDITGYTAEEFLGNPELIVHITYPADRPLYLEHIKNELHPHRKSADLFFRIVHKNGEIRWIWHRCQPVFLDDGRWRGRRTTNRDITTQKMAEKRIAEQQKLFDAGPTIIFRWRATENWPVDYVSPNIEHVLGYTPEELLNGTTPFAHLVHPDDLTRIVKEVKEFSSSNVNSFEQEYRILDSNGKVRWVYDKTNILRSEQGEITHYHGYLVEITKQVEQQNILQENSIGMKLALDMANLGYWNLDYANNKISFSPELYFLLGLDEKSFVPSKKNLLRLVDPPDRKPVLSCLRRMINGESTQSVIEFNARHGSGSLLNLRMKHQDVSDTTGKIIGRQGICQDITSFKQTEGQLLISSMIFDHSIEGIIITDQNGVIQRANPSACKITGYPEEELLGQKTSLIKSSKHSSTFYSKMWHELLINGSWQGEIWNKRKNGEVYPEWLSIVAVRDGHGELIKFIAVFHDISEEKQHEMTIYHQAHHDALTGMPNRVLLLDRLKMAMRMAKHMVDKVAILSIDLDNFKHINDSLGHSIGDQLLRDATERLKACVRKEDTIARPGGDEFVIILNSLKDTISAERTARHILQSFRKPFHIQEHELFATASIGLSFYPEDGGEEEQLISNADLAMSEAKKEGKNSYRLFTPSLNERVTRRLSLGNRLQRAIEHNEFAIYYQPKVLVNTGEIYGVEALIRWHPDPDTVISPAEFIPLAEETGLIIPIGQFVLDQACRQAMLWQQQGFKLSVAVNLSTVQFNQKNFVETVEAIIEKNAIPTRLLELEITESLMMDNEDIAIDYLWKLKNMGISLSVDDFGTGYSSLSYLKQLPIDCLKIDQTFIKQLPANSDDILITSAIISMAKSLGLDVVAEGVESIEQCKLLQEKGCNKIQGFLISPPLPADELTPLLLSPSNSPL